MMKQYIVRLFSCMLLIAGAVVNVNAAGGIIETLNYTRCYGDSVEFDNGLVVKKDTMWRDTMHSYAPGEDSIYVYIVHFRPMASVMYENRTLQVGTSFPWRGITINHPGEYIKTYQSQFGCDSLTVRLTVTPVYADDYHYVTKDTTICDGSSVTWRGKVHTLPNVYVDTAHAADPKDRDTLYILNLQVAKPFKKIESLETSTFPFSYRGLTWNENEAGTMKSVTYTSFFGCDSTYEVTVNKKHVTVDHYASLCADDEDGYEWRGTTYYEQGTYYQYVKTKDGQKDSITYVLHLTVNPTPTTYRQADICFGGAYNFEGTLVSAPGRHTKTLKTPAECDSTIVLYLNVHYQDTTDTVVHLEQGQSITWHGTDYSAEGTYTRMFVNRFGCDSIARLHITTHHIDTVDTMVVLCPNETITWHGMTTSDSGDYSSYEEVDASRSVLYRMTVQAKKLEILNKSLTICDNNPVYFLDSAFTQAGTYDLYYTCDTLYHVIVSKPAIATRTFDVVYDGAGAYIWRFEHEGATKTFSCNGAGTYEQRLDNTTGCQNIYILNLKVDSLTYHIHDTLSVCEGEAFEWQGYTNLSSLHVGETYTYSKGFKTQTQKDSIHYLHLTVYPKQEYELGTVEFLSFPTNYLGVTVTGPGRYYAHLTSVHGCDSTVNFSAKRQVITKEVTDSVCEGSSYAWRGYQLDAAGTYQEVEPAQDGSDSVIHKLTLTLKNRAYYSYYEQICAGGSYSFGGQTLTKGGVYRDTLMANNGCDSVITLNLSVLNADTVAEAASRYEGDTIHWRGKVITSPAVVDSTITNRFGCDSITYRLILTATQKVDTIDTTATICSGEYLKWHGRRYYTAGNYSNIDTLSNGDIAYSRLHLTVTGIDKKIRSVNFTICQGETVHYFDSIYTRQGVYDYPYSCDSIHRITITVKPTYTHITRATFNGTDPYIWKKAYNGSVKDSTITAEGIYDNQVLNDTTGCYDLYRLYLALDTASYHYEEVATKCYGEPMMWHGQDLTNRNVGVHDDIYYITKTANNKDSIHHLTLTVYPTYNLTERVEYSTFPASYKGLTFDAPGAQVLHQTTTTGCDSIITVYADKRVLTAEESASICYGEDYEWHGKHYNATGDYTIADTTLSGDSINYTLHLTVVYNPDTLLHKRICRGDSYIFGGQMYTEAGVYTHISYKNGCEAKAILNLEVMDNSTTVVNLTIAKDSSIVWNGITCDEEKDYEYHTTNANGCDSVVILHLAFLKTDTVERSVTLCPDSTYTWNGRTFFTTGTHEWTETQPNGNMIRYILHLKVLEKVTQEFRYSICSGEQITIDGKTYSRDTAFYHAHSCDTVFHVVITSLPSLSKVTDADFDGTSYRWYINEAGIDTTITSAGTYFKYRTNATTGCQDVYRLILREVKPDDRTYLFDDEMTVCEGENVIWRGNNHPSWSKQGIGQTTDYYERYTTIYGKDSVYHLALTVRPAPHTTTRIPFCESIVWNGITITKDTVINDSSKTAYGCDSITEVIFEKGNSMRLNEIDSIAPGESIEWHGKTIDHEGVFEDIHQSVLGCDSSYTLTVTFKQEVPTTKTRTYRVTICDGDVYEWRTRYYRETGLYYDTLKTGTTIDSIYILNLTVNPTYYFTESVMFPKAQFPVTYRGKRFSQPGSAEIKYVSSLGCDSIIKVTVNYQHITYKETVTICAGEMYPWHRHEYHEAGIYTDRIPDAKGNDSVTYILDLHVKYIPVTRVDSTICSGDAVSFGGQMLNESGSYIDTLKSEGCDSVVILTLHVVENTPTVIAKQINPEQLPITWKGQTCTEAGAYYDYGVDAHGCQTTTILNLTVNHVDTVDTAATICPGETLVWHGINGRETRTYSQAEEQPNGDFVVYRLDLTVREQVTIDTTFTICNGESLTFNGHTYMESGYYRDNYNNCDTVYDIYIQKQSNQVYVTEASLNSTDEGFPWQVWHSDIHGQATAKDTIYKVPGTYEYYVKNNETGCNDIYRLILTKDNNSYHMIDTLYICKGDAFNWRGRSSYNVGENHYVDSLETRTGNDSIYELYLFVGQHVYADRYQRFCGTFTWKGETYDRSIILTDTLLSQVPGVCDSIVRYHYTKLTPVTSYETATIIQGEVLSWRKYESITTDGRYTDVIQTQDGCDSIIYYLDVTLEAATPQTNLKTIQESICEGSGYLWRGEWRSPTSTTTYVDTVFKSNVHVVDSVDSIYALKLVVWPTYRDTITRHQYVCSEHGAIKFNGHVITKDTCVDTTYATVHGCDSIEKIYFHITDGLIQYDTVRITDKQIPYTWPVRPDTAYSQSGNYYYEKQMDGQCPMEYHLNLIIDKSWSLSLDTAICIERLPFYWVIGDDTIGNRGFSHAAGETITYDINYPRKDANNKADSLYLLTLRVDDVPKRVVHFDLCEGESLHYNGKDYKANQIPAGTILRDTLNKSSDNACDSLIIVEIASHGVNRHYETKIIKHDEDMFTWHGRQIDGKQSGTYQDTIPSTNPSECYSIEYLNAVKEDYTEWDRCIRDTVTQPESFMWHGYDLKQSSSRIYHDSVFDPGTGLLTDFFTLDLTMLIPKDTTIFLRSCKTNDPNNGVTWNGVTYNKDTVIRDTMDCSMNYTIHIKLDTTYTIVKNDTICESQLPYILGRQDPKEIWEEGRYYKKDTTACGCDSTILVNLYIRPNLERTDSTFRCENDLLANPVILGDTVYPKFAAEFGGHYTGEWRGKWHGVKYKKDTIVYDCDSTFSHHIIMRPSQKVAKDTTIWICPHDTIMFRSIHPENFWDDSTFFTKDTLYQEIVPMVNTWTDPKHNHTYHNDAYTCDSVTNWWVKVLDIRDKDTTIHKLLGDSVLWGHRWYHHTGDYDSIAQSTDTNVLGERCTYTYTLHLIMDTAYFFRDTINVCVEKGHTYAHTFKDKHVIDYTVGIKDSMYHYYPDSMKSHEGRDSVYQLWVNYTIIRDTVLYYTMCPGDSIQFDQHHYRHNNNTTTARYLTAAGIYTDTIRLANGCDSIIELHLDLYPRNITSHATVHIADSVAPYAWIHQWPDATAPGGVRDSVRYLIASGGYEFHTKDIHGCDSIDSLTLHIHKTYKIQEKDTTICESDLPFVWQGRNDIMESGTYYFHTVTHDGYDSTRYINLYVDPVEYDTIRVSTCWGDSVLYNGTWYKEPGEHTFTRLTDKACDSIITLIYSWKDKYYIRKSAQTSDKVPYVWTEGTISKTLTHSGVFYDTLTSTVYGCDSIIELTLTVYPTYEFHEDTVVCESELPYMWRGKQIYTNGTHYDSLQTVNHYDSVYVLDFKFNKSHVIELYNEICEGDSIRFGLTQLGQERFLTAQGTYYDTLLTKYGCDSIVMLHLNVYPKHYSHAVVDIADTKLPYAWKHTWTAEDGTPVDSTRWIFGSGEYGIVMRSTLGCDSIDSLTLRVHQTYNIKEDTIDLCSDQTPYVWCDQDNITTTGTYTYYGHTVEGYDSIHTIHINVWPVKYSTLTVAICDGDKYRFDTLGGSVERWLTKQGTYYDTLRTAHGCDSIVTLNLTVHPLYHNLVNRSIYEGDTVMFEGQPYTKAGNYPIRYTSNITGCDSIVELRLSVNKLYDDSISVCYNTLPFVWHNKTILESGIYKDTLYNNEGQRTITGIKVEVLPIARLERPLLDTICQGDTYLFGSKRRELTESGTYYDTLIAVNGCDSIVTLVLNVQPVKYQTEKKTIFEGDSILFYDGTWKKQSGIYNYSEPVANGRCSDIYQLVLTVVKPLELDTIAAVCENELPYLWHGHEFNQTGSYTLPISWTDTTRVTMTLHLTVNDVPRQERVVDICEGSTYIYKGREYRSNDIFYDTIPSLVGCDSIIKHIIRVHPTFDRIDTVHISDKQPYVFHDRVLTSSGTYEWTGTTKYGCDSMEHLVLIVHPSYFFTDTVDLCQPDTLDWHGLKIMQSGKYSDSLLTAPYGFDSIYEVIVNVHSSYFIKEQYEIGDGEILKIHGRDISQPAIYFDTLRTIHGCDSIFHVVVNQKRTREFTWTREICQGESYNFFGRNLTHTGQYKYTSQYKDSVVTLNLTVNPISITENRVVITDRQLPYVFGGKIYDAGGVYNDTLVNRYGCDSILRLVLVVSTHYSDWTPIPLCPGSEVKIDGDTITQAGLYTFLRRSRATGEMDSIYRVEVYDAPAYEFDVTHTMCQGDTVFYGDKAITRGGHHDIRLKTTEGCDSIYHLDLTVYPAYHFITDTTITDYQSVVWRGKTYRTSGNYDISFPTVNDCDSTYTLSMYVVQTQRDTVEETICTGQSYTWRGKTYSTDGIFTDTVWQPATHYSAIHVLHLIIAYPTIITSATTGDICADAESFDIQFEYDGQTPSYYSVYFDALAKREGFVDIINAPLYGEMVAHIAMPQFASIAYETHPYYVRPDYYTMHLVLDNGVCGISRSDSLTLLIKYPSWIIEQNWNDVVIPLKSEYNGGFEFAQIEWLVNNVPQPTATAGYLHNTSLVKGDQVVMKATRRGEKYAIPTCPLIITDPVITGNDVPVIVYPTQAPRHAPVVTVEALHEGTYEIFSSTGTLLSTGTFTEGTTQVTLPSTSGIYFIRAHQGNETSSHKVLLY